GEAGRERAGSPRPRALRDRCRRPRAPAGRPRAGRRAGSGARTAELRARRRAARVDQRRGVGGPGRRGRLPARPQMTREQVYGRRAVREALRGPREVLELWTTERALKAEPWLREPGPSVRHQVKA